MEYSFYWEPGRRFAIRVPKSQPENSALAEHVYSFVVYQLVYPHDTKVSDHDQGLVDKLTKLGW